ncbi:SLC13 family permease [Yunchengibacter salinarum]|uniref:SLC13 family permease n=1 Tax=Yunchengibacter salinarum TaxID=3133399 RepID=UPI0035B63AC8
MPDTLLGPMDSDMILTLTILVGVFVLFVRDAYPPHMVALGAMATLIATGIISTEQALGVFSSAAPITIAAMFVLSAALESSGVIALIGRKVLNVAARNQFLALVGLLGAVMVSSAMMNNTPIVIVMAPVIIAVAKELGDYSSKYLIPLSYAAILGGTTTLIGTSTNILVAGMAADRGMTPFTMFEIAPAGLVVAGVGAVYLAVIGRKLLPKREMMQQQLVDEDRRKNFIAEMLVPSGSPLVGRTLNQVNIPDSIGCDVVDLVREGRGSRSVSRGFRSRMADVIGRGRRRADARLEEDSEARQIIGDTGVPGTGKSAFRDVPLSAGDRIVLRTSRADLMAVRRLLHLTPAPDAVPGGEPVDTRRTEVVEGVVSHMSDLIGKRPADLRYRRYYRTYILAVHRASHHIIGHFEDLTLRHGDVLLVEGPEDELDELFRNEDLERLTPVADKPLHRRKAWVSLMAILGVIGLAAAGVMPIAGLALIATVLVVACGCVTPEAAYRAIEWRILLLIFGMLSLSKAMETTGVANLIVSTMADHAAAFGPLAVLAMTYLMTSVMTELLSNNAAAVLLTPLAIGIADQMGVDARPLLVAVMFGASASFATPIGYQTNTYVFNAGNYRFTDFVRVGLPLNLILLVVAVLVIPEIWEF